MYDVCAVRSGQVVFFFYQLEKLMPDNAPELLIESHSS